MCLSKLLWHPIPIVRSKRRAGARPVVQRQPESLENRAKRRIDATALVGDDLAPGDIHQVQVVGAMYRH